ncbi:MAG TPA: transcription antitermination factor NusB [Polyangia bacterium]|nr:transcription antitermination factor NusB [Polyangia bacterium]
MTTTSTAGPRRRAREIALQVLHAMDVSPEQTADEALRRTFEHLLDEGRMDDEGEGDVERPDPRFDRPLVEAVVRGYADKRAAIDEALAGLSRNWRVERIAVVERNIIRLALWELLYGGEPPVPPSVVLNEAIELCKRYGTAEGAAFVNGLLDRALAELPVRR